MNASNTPASRTSRATRSSLACVPCRSRHIKCDGNRPCCGRCGETAQKCYYAPSRRGGLDRAALAQRRRQRLVGAEAGAVNIPAAQYLLGTQQDRLVGTQAVDISYQSERDSHTETISGSETSFTASTAVHDDHTDNIQTDRLLDAYYMNFHKFHPFLLPRKHLVQLCQDPSKQPRFRPLIAMMRFIGNIYASSGEWSVPLKDYAVACLSQAPPKDPILVQCRLLYSVALFWTDRKSEGLCEIDNAIRLGVELQMHQRDFAAKHGADDTILRECWRRTWWTLFILDTYYSGALGSLRSGLSDIEATVDLPCEESEYESGNIPDPQTVQEFDNREFAPGATKFSSFAYLVGAVRCAAISLSETLRDEARVDSVHVIQRIDSVLNGWLLLLPKDRKQVMTKAGDIDELMFQAHLVIHVATIALHRPFSDLKFNPVECVSSCAREPPPETPTPELVNVHTLRVLRSVEEQIQLMALPVRQFQHSPFVCCMIDVGTLALLSACKFLHKGIDLTIARNQIRMAIGRLNDLADLWPRAARNVREIQTIARHVLGLVPESSEGQLLSREDGQENTVSEMPSVEASILPDYVDLCGWYNVGDLDLSDLLEVNNAA